MTHKPMSPSLSHAAPLPPASPRLSRGARLALTTAKGGEIAMEQKIEGVVKYLNDSRHGEVNGAVLDNGNFVHLGPKGAKRVKLAIGEKLVVEGSATTMGDGHLVMEEPSEVNGVKIP